MQPKYFHVLLELLWIRRLNYSRLNYIIAVRNSKREVQVEMCDFFAGLTGWNVKNNLQKINVNRWKVYDKSTERGG